MLQADLEDCLETPWVTLELERTTLNISVGRRESLDLLDLVDHKRKLSPRAALLGWTSDDRPLLLNFASGGLSNVLFYGATGAGKTAALRTCAVSLALGSRQSQVQMLFLDPQCGRAEAGSAPGLASLHYLPHALTAVVSSLEDAAAVLASLTDEMTYRSQHNIREPRIVVFIDNLDALLDDGGTPVRQPLQQLLSGGSVRGIHLVLAARPEESGSDHQLEDLLGLNSVLKIVGGLSERYKAPQSAFVPNVGAEHLVGLGDFLVVGEDEAIRFQAAYVDSYDLHWCLETLQRRRPPAVLARSAKAAPPISSKMAENGEIVKFAFDGHQVSVT
jgi:DNA segregation ATPase FtsK/SpoIIIE-like protein